MSAFVFRLQKVFEYREMEESWAKDLYLKKQIARIEAEREFESIASQRRFLLMSGADDIQTRLDLEMRLSKLDDLERANRLLVMHLQEEEDQARAEWMERRQDKDVLGKLREKARSEWVASEERKEQIAMDEWATQRRKIA
jgi:flagellar export protein FliJ